MQAQPIADNVSVVDTNLKKTQRAFLSGKTKPLSYRIQQLKNLKNGIASMYQDLIDAVKADLGREDFVTWLSEINVVNKEIDHAIQNIN